MAVPSTITIGEVLSLLQPDFPDISISKIRFLEGQGLIDPERTPSGYRKFREPDIERLRWILVQQRDHFLPLKVIKERLASGELDGPAQSELPLEMAQVIELHAVEPVAEVETPISTASESPSEPSPVSEIAAPIVAAEEPSTSTKRRERADLIAALVESPPEATAHISEEPSKASPASASRQRRRHPTGHTKGDPTPEGEVDIVDPLDVSELALTLEELCQQSGLSPAEIEELEKFGLLSPGHIGRVAFYDADALTVARLAGGFSRYGIEPRHLRMYKTAAEREASMFEQLITPLLKQRRAEARDRAVEILEDLAELADDLRAVMVKLALREYLGAP